MSLTPHELQQRWKRMCGDTRPGDWDNANTYGFFADIAADEDARRQALEGVPGGEQIAARLQELSEASQRSVYLLPRGHVTSEEALRLGQQILAFVVRMSAELGDDPARTEALRKLKPAVATGNDDEDGIAATIPDIEYEWFSMKCQSEFMYAMNDAAYTIAADQWLANFVLWPLTGESDDPYRPYFEAWKVGLTPLGAKAGRLTFTKQ